MNLSLIRDYLGGDCSQGKLTVSGQVFDTMERPWIATASGPCGTKGVSCVPPGLYKLMPHNSEAHPRTWALVNPDLWIYHWDEDVPEPQIGIARTLVLLHVANFAQELRGCIAPGMDRAVDPMGRKMVTKSAMAMKTIQGLLTWDASHTLEIA